MNLLSLIMFINILCFSNVLDVKSKKFVRKYRIKFFFFYCILRIITICHNSNTVIQ